MGGAGFASLFGSSPIILIQTQDVITPDTGSVTAVGAASALEEAEAPTFQFVVTLHPALQFKTGM